MLRHRRFLRLTPVAVFAISLALLIVSLWQIDVHLKQQVRWYEVTFPAAERLLRLEERAYGSAYLAATALDDSIRREGLLQHEVAVKELAEAIEEVRKTADQARPRLAVAALAAANRRRLELELYSFDLIKERRFNKARAVLSDPAYRRERSRFEESVRQFEGEIIQVGFERVGSYVSFGRLGWLVLLLIASVSLLLWIVFKHFFRLQEEHDHLDRVLLTAPEVVTIYDLEDKRLTYINPKVLETLGYGTEEMKELSATAVEKLIHPDDLALIADHQVALQQAGDGTILDVQYRVRHKDGRWIWLKSFDTVFSRAANGKPREILGFSTDITESVQAAESLRLTIEATSDIVVLFDAKNRYIEVYSGPDKPLAAPREQLIGKTVREVLGDGLADRIEPKLKAVLETGKTETLEYDLTFGGEKMSFQAMMSRRDANTVVAAIRDVSRLRQFAAETRMLRERLELALSSIGIGVWDWDIGGDRLHWDESMFRIFGVDPNSFRGGFDDWHRTIHPKDADRAIQEVQAARDGVKDFDTRFRIVRKDGVRHIRGVAIIQRNERGEATRMVGLNWDVTREAQLSADLEAQRHFMENILNAVPDPIFVKDERHRWIYGNHAFSVLLDRIPEDYVGKSDYDIFNNELANSYWDSDSETFSRMTEVEREERITLPDGEYRTILTKKTPFSAPDGQKTLVGIIRDITERKAMQKQIEEERARQVAASRLASLGEMAGGVAHEVNNPLAIIAGFSSRLAALFEEEKFDRDRAQDIVSKIESTTMRIATIVKGLRAIARDGGLDPKEVVDIKSIVQDTLDLCSERFRAKGVGIDVRIEGDQTDPFLIDCRAVQISQVFLNLMTNAFYAVAPQDSAHIILEVRRRESGDVEVGVIDSGPGVDPAIRERIFEPFFTTKPVGAGTGLGLSIAASIVKEHGGELYLDQESASTRFVIVLPRPGTGSVRPSA